MFTTCISTLLQPDLSHWEHGFSSLITMCYTCIQCGWPLLISTYDMGVSHLVFHIGNRVDALSDVVIGRIVPAVAFLAE